MSQSDLDEIEKAIREARSVSHRIREALSTLDTTIDNALVQMAEYNQKESTDA